MNMSSSTFPDSLEVSYRLFLPRSIENHECFLFGHRHETKSENSLKKLVEYYVIEASKTNERSELEFIGELVLEKSKKTSLTTSKKSVLRIPSKNLHLIIEEQLECNSSTVILYYDKKKFLQSQIDSFDETSINNHFGLTLAKHLSLDSRKRQGTFAKSPIPMQWLTTIGLLLSKLTVILSPMFKNTVTYKHCVSWKKCFVNSTHLRNGFVILDIILGVVFLLILTHIRECGKYFMDLTEIIVRELRKLLTMLEGSPVGLKLNEQLNVFLLNCFMYHVDLWFNFIIIIEPAIRLLILPISLIGIAGFSFQCAIICDLFTLLTLHAHCFYIYAAMLYKLELKGLQSLWRIVLGRRKNVLKNRVESQEYTKRQLFLATLFFTVLLFLLPTVIIYYLVFATVSQLKNVTSIRNYINLFSPQLRFAIYCLTYLMNSLQQKILEFPFLKFLRWFFGMYVDPTNCSINVLKSESGVLEVEISLKNSSPWIKSKFEKRIDLQLPKLISLNVFAMQLVRGDIMAF